MTIPFTLSLTNLKCPHCGSIFNVDYSMYEIESFTENKTVDLIDKAVTCWNCKKYIAVEAHLRPTITVSALNKEKP
jgi:hypothetical protein